MALVAGCAAQMSILSQQLGVSAKEALSMFLWPSAEPAEQGQSSVQTQA